MNAPGKSIHFGTGGRLLRRFAAPMDRHGAEHAPVEARLSKTGGAHSGGQLFCAEKAFTGAGQVGIGFALAGDQPA